MTAKVSETIHPFWSNSRYLRSHTDMWNIYIQISTCSVPQRSELKVRNLHGELKSVDFNDIKSVLQKYHFQRAKSNVGWANFYSAVALRPVYKADVQAEWLARLQLPILSDPYIPFWVKCECILLPHVLTHLFNGSCIFTYIKYFNLVLNQNIITTFIILTMCVIKSIPVIHSVEIILLPLEYQRA